MNKNMIIISVIGVIIVVLVAGGLLYVNQQNSGEDKMMASDEAMTKDDSMNPDAMMEEESMEKDEMMMDKTTNAKYVEYSTTALQSDADKKVLFFYANWCPTCRPVDAEIKSNLDKVPDDMSIIRVNYNDTDTDQEEKNLAKKYNITYQHTFVQIDENGNEIKKWNGGGLNQILSNIN